MILKTHFLIFLFSSAVVAIIHADEGSGPQPPPSTQSPNVTTSVPPTTSPVTKPPPTTSTATPPTTSTVTPPTTSTVTPPPTTSTQTPPPTTSTVTPPTTPPTPPTTPPTPPTTPSTPPTPPPTTPKPAPKSTEWVVRDKNNTICILANMVININVKFPTKTNKTEVRGFKIQKIEEAVASGIFYDHNQTLVLTVNESLVVEFLFVQNVTNGTAANTYSLSKIMFTVPVKELPEIDTTESKVVFTHHTKVFSLALNKSYSCAAENSLSLNGTTNNKTVSGDIILSSVHVEAFGKKDKASYSAAVECPHTNPTPDIVPIVVGLVLAGLVIVVLIAYLVGRRRAQARGYLSM